MLSAVVAAPVEDLEVRIARWDLTDVLGPVELPFGVVVVGVQPNGDDSRRRGARGVGSRCTSGTCRACLGCGGCAPARAARTPARRSRSPRPSPMRPPCGEQPHRRLAPVASRRSWFRRRRASRRVCGSCRRPVGDCRHAAVTRLIDTQPSSRISRWWWTPRSAVS